jgi:hypothetical protein
MANGKFYHCFAASRERGAMMGEKNRITGRKWPAVFPAIVARFY